MFLDSTILVVGGDKRLYYLTKRLKEYFPRVTGYAQIDQQDIISDDSFKEAMELADIIIGPIPFTRDNIHLVSETVNKITLRNLCDNLHQNQLLFAANIPEEVLLESGKKGVTCHDFMKMEQVAADNAIATAEGAIAEAITLSVSNMYLNNCLILGYGRCGKAIAERAKALGANVTIAVRNETVQSEILQQGYHAISLKKVSDIAENMQFIFNTIPAMMLTESILCNLDQDAVIIDIASAPGGTDFKACEQLKIPAVLSLGIPGKYSPKSSADILLDAILQTLHYYDEN